MDATARLTTAGNVLFGGWLIAAPFVFATSGVASWNDILVGTAVALLAGYNYARLRSRRPATATGAGLVALLGCWLVVAPFVFGLSLEELAVWNSVCTGTVLTSFGSYNVYITTAAGPDSSFRTTAK